MDKFNYRLTTLPKFTNTEDFVTAVKAGDVNETVKLQIDVDGKTRKFYVSDADCVHSGLQYAERYLNWESYLLIILVIFVVLIVLLILAQRLPEKYRIALAIAMVLLSIIAIGLVIAMCMIGLP